jgi:hypothetical protein
MFLVIPSLTTRGFKIFPCCVDIMVRGAVHHWAVVNEENNNIVIKIILFILSSKM